MKNAPGTVLVALGGNALAPPGKRATIHDQFRYTRQSLAAVVALAQEGWHIAVVHGNGPQVGDALERNELAREVVEPLPLGVLVASTAGWIGYMIQQSLQNALRRAGIQRQVLTVITQTTIRFPDPTASRPTKPIGLALSQARVASYEERGVPVGQDGAGRWRRLAPSPHPEDIVEAQSVRQLVAEGKIVIAAGGGGAPVYLDEHGRWEGVDAVVDKDRAAAILGRRLGAETLLILTDVDGVYRDWGTDRAERLPRISVLEAEELLESGQLGAGSMRPKVAAAAAFVRDGGERAVIAQLADGVAAVRGETGTLITGVS